MPKVEYHPPTLGDQSMLHISKTLEFWTGMHCNSWMYILLCTLQSLKFVYPKYYKSSIESEIFLLFGRFGHHGITKEVSYFWGCFWGKEKLSLCIGTLESSLKFRQSQKKTGGVLNFKHHKFVLRLTDF